MLDDAVPMTTTATLVLGSATDDALMGTIARGLSAAGLSVVTVELDASRDQDDEAHRARFRDALEGVAGPRILGGFSLGGRIAATLCRELAPLALLCFGYPFHAAGDPSRRHGLDALLAAHVPARIVQGTRDNHGSEAEVRGYRLPDSIELVWLRDGNHRFVPRERSGLTQAAHVERAVASAISFARSR